MPEPHDRAWRQPRATEGRPLTAIAVGAAAMLLLRRSAIARRSPGRPGALGSLFGVGAGVLVISLLPAFIVVRLLRRRGDRAQPGGRA